MGIKLNFLLKYYAECVIIILSVSRREYAGVMESADVLDSKISGSNTVRVRPPPPHHKKQSLRRKTEAFALCSVCRAGVDPFDPRAGIGGRAAASNDAHEKSCAFLFRARAGGRLPLPMTR